MIKTKSWKVSITHLAHTQTRGYNVYTIMNKNSGSAEDSDMAIIVDDPDELLRLCPGGCKKKILFFGDDNVASGSVDWADQINNMMCLDCRANLLRSV